MLTNVIRRAGALLAIGLVIALAGTAFGIINPRFTPTDLVRGSSDVYLLDVRAPEKGEVSAEILETIKGKPPAEKKLVFSYSDAKELTEEQLAQAFGKAKTAVGLLLISSPQPGEEGPRPASLIIGTMWFSVAQEQGKSLLDRDSRELTAVWAGSARMMAEATRYVEADPTAYFPVRSDLSWARDLNLGKLAGAAHGCLAARLDAPTGDCVIVLADGGDRVYQAPAPEAQPADITAKLKLTTASKLAALGDFDGDGRLDLASWDGQAFKLAIRGADGTFTVRDTHTKMPSCLSLDVLDAGAKGGAGLLAGTPSGPVLLVPDGAGSFSATPLAAPQQVAKEDKLKQDGLCVAADFDGDGRCDVMHLFSKGALFFAGEAPGKFKPPVDMPASGLRNPHSAVSGDFDADGRLDLVVAGDDGVALMSHAENRRLEDNTFVTGELWYHGGQNSPSLVSASPCDMNNDGRQGVALFYQKQKPMLFFNRGFACFGWARELDVVSPPDTSAPGLGAPGEKAETKLASTEAIQNGQLAGTIADLDGDGAQDLVCVSPQGEVWALYGQSENQRPLGLTMCLSGKSHDPLTVSVSDQKRRLGTYVVRPGIPVFAGRANAGPLNLEWRGPDGKPRSRKVVVTSLARVELDPLAAP